MDNFEIENVLRTMSIVVDNREQPGDRADKRYRSFGVPYNRATLNYGDYTYNAVLPNGQPIYDLSKTIYPKVIVERKMSLEELSGCFTGKTDIECKKLGVRNRFDKELFRAADNKCKIYLLVEDATYEKILNHRYSTGLNPKSFISTLFARVSRYDVTPIFVQHELSGRLIYEILYRELKERLENGEYDEYAETDI